jgi:hypothetical protein
MYDDFTSGDLFNVWLCMSVVDDDCLQIRYMEILTTTEKHKFLSGTHFSPIFCWAFPFRTISRNRKHTKFCFVSLKKNLRNRKHTWNLISHHLANDTKRNFVCFLFLEMVRNKNFACSPVFANDTKRKLACFLLRERCETS